MTIDPSKQFNRAARPAGLLKFAFDHASKMSSIGYMAGNVVQLVKHGFHADLTSAAGVCFMAGAASMWAANTRPWMIKGNGVMTIVGNTLMGASYFNTPGFAAQVLGVAPAILQGGLMLMDSQTSAPVGKGSVPAILRKPYDLVRRYPVVASACLGLSGGPGLLTAAIADRDWGQIATAVGWIFGDLNCGLTDPALRRKIAADAPPPPAPL